MRGYTLIDSLATDFRVTGTAGQAVFTRDQETGLVSEVVGTEREVHEDGTVTHWIVTTER